MNTIRCVKLLNSLIFSILKLKHDFHFDNYSQRGISSIVSSAVLLSSFTVMGTMAVSWSQNTVATHEQSLGLQYTAATNKIKESMSLENFWYDTPHQKLNIVLKNTAQIGMTVIQIQVQGASSQVYSYTPTQILPGVSYTATVQYGWMGDPLDVFVTTARGSIFRFHIAAPTDGILILKKVSILGNGNFSFSGDLGKFNVTTTGYVPNAGLDSQGDLILSGTIRDFNGTGYQDKDLGWHYPKGSHPDFEKPCINSGDCPFGEYDGIVLPDLGSDEKPVYNNSTNYAFNHGFKQFYQWYHDNSTINISEPLSLNLTKIGNSPPTWKFTSTSFFPIDNQLWNCCGYDSLGQSGKWHNFSFTYEIHNSFTYMGGETFTFTGDDDVWLFINHKLVVDIGGVHSAITKSISLDSLGLIKGNSYNFDFFYAERHTTQSDMTMTTSIQLQNNGVGNTAAFFVNPGKYNINEIVPSGWSLLNEQCTNGYTLVNATEITVTVPKGTTTCTFTNSH